MTQATSPTPLARPDTLAAWLGVPADNPKLLAALDAASARFRGAVRHPVTAVTGDDVTLDGTGSVVLQLPAIPVTRVDSIAVDGTELADGEFDWSADGLLYRAATWPHRYRAVSVRYDHGYESVPSDIAEVVIDQARRLYTAPAGITQAQAGGEQYSFGTTTVGVTSQWTQAVANYRVHRGDEA